jgi:octaprenyl-diphosphate synthase
MPAPDKEASQITDQIQPAELLSFCNPVQLELTEVHKRIAGLLQSPDSQINTCLNFLSEQSGKMLRPALVLLSGKCFGDINAEHIDLAAMIELVHRASLLHDDVIDSAEVRHGKHSANILWGNTAAVLLGDFLLSRAFYLGAHIGHPAATEILSCAAQELCRGELLQNFQKDNWEITEQQYYRIIEAKTAALFKSSCQLGAVASNASPQQTASLGQFGLELGIAFQITDDLLDILGTQQGAGKTLGTDLVQGKLTLPLIHWIGSDEQEKPRRMNLLNQQNTSDVLISHLRESCSVNYALIQVRKRIASAREHIAGFDHSTARDALMDMADYVADRLK